MIKKAARKERKKERERKVKQKQDYKFLQDIQDTERMNTSGISPSKTYLSSGDYCVFLSSAVIIEDLF